ncbi:MAG: hypothetical protein ACXVW1_01400, partial [Nocardioides sp.]
MRRRSLVPLVLLVLGAALGAALVGAPPGPATGSPPGARVTAERGAVGHWTKISTGTVGIIDEASLHRTPDGVLHVLYPQEVGSNGQLGHTALSTTGATLSQGEVLPAAWDVRDSSPVLVGDGGTGLRAVFGGIESVDPGYWSDGRMYTATAPEAGTPWTLSAQAVGASHSAYASYGTAATTLPDGTPVAAFPLNSTVTWHVGTGEADPDQSFTVGSCCAYDLAAVDDGGTVWLGWYANGSTPATNGTFVREIYPALGAVLKAPGSSVGSDSLPTGRVALVARTGGGVYAAYCVGYPTCTSIRLWHVGTTTTATVPGSRYADNPALAAGPQGRLWLAWSDNVPRVRVMRTGRSGLRAGAVRTLGSPPATSSVYTVAVDARGGRGDVVVNIGNAFWHTQVLPGTTLQAAPRSWRHGRAQRVTFTVTDAGDAVPHATVRVGTRH